MAPENILWVTVGLTAVCVKFLLPASRARDSFPVGVTPAAVGVLFVDLSRLDTNN